MAPIITAYKKAYELTIINETIVDGDLSGSNLVLTKKSGGTITIPSVIGVEGPVGEAGETTLWTWYNVQDTSGGYNLVWGDDGGTIVMDYPGANTLGVPPHSFIPFPIGTIVSVIQKGVGKTTVAQTDPITFRSHSSWKSISMQNGRITLEKVGNDEWYIFGNLAT